MSQAGVGDGADVQHGRPAVGGPGSAAGSAAFAVAALRLTPLRPAPQRLRVRGGKSNCRWRVNRHMAEREI
jgi:hypothetical protein